MSAIKEDFTLCFELEFCRGWQLHVCVYCFAEVLLQNDEGTSNLCQNTVSQDVLGKQRFLESVIYKSWQMKPLHQWRIQQRC